MKVSKFKRVDENILLEYIYDNENLISEAYSITINTDQNGRRGFVSASASVLSKNANIGIDQRSSILSNKNVEANQLVRLDQIENQYGRLGVNTISFVNRKDYGTSIPIRYDKVRVHVPVNYTFENYVGFHVKIFTLDYDNVTEIDLSNYFFNMKDVNQQNDLDFNSNPLLIGETNWGKYIEIEFPSPNKVSDQRKNGKVRENTINYNLTDGVGLSKTAPVFVNFHFIKSMSVKDSGMFYILESEVSTSFPHAPEYENFGLTVEPSIQGDFFLIYPTFNGSIGEFNQWMEDSILEGNRYYLEYIIDIFEKNIKTNTQKIIVTEDFIEEIEYRPILKYSTTTAIIDVTCNLIDAVDETKTTRKASYGMLQDEVSKFSRYLSKINLKKANKEEVHKIKSFNVPNTSDNSLQVKTELTVEKTSFTVYSKRYQITTGDKMIEYKGKQWKQKKNLKVDVFPFENIMIFETIEKNTLDEYKPFDYSKYSDIKLNIKSDNKNVTFEIYNDSDINDKENGIIVFRIREGRYNSIKKIYQNGFRNFYITGKENNNESIIYSGKFNPWNSESNKFELQRQYNSSQSFQPQTVEVPSENKDKKILEEVKDIINKEETTPKTINTSGNTAKEQRSPNKKNIPKSQQKKDIKFKLNTKWRPYWNSPTEVLMRSFEYKSEKNSTDAINEYYTPGDIRKFAISMKNAGILSKIDVDKNTGNLSIFTQREVDIILGYFRVMNFNPNDMDIIGFITQFDDITKWVNAGLNSKRKSVIASSYKDVKSGINTPPDIETYELLKLLNSFEISEKNENIKRKVTSEQSDRFRRKRI